MRTGLARLKPSMVPAHVVFRKGEEFPRTPTGKVQKPQLREELSRVVAGSGTR